MQRRAVLAPGAVREPVRGPAQEPRQAAGWIVYGPLNGDAATGVNAMLVQAMMGTGTPANRALIPPGYVFPNDPPLARGHLLGRQLGGSGDTLANLVTLYQSMIASPMQAVENSVRRTVEACEVVNFSSIPIYQGVGALPVKSISIIAIGSRGFSYPGPLLPNVP